MVNVKYFYIIHEFSLGTMGCIEKQLVFIQLCAVYFGKNPETHG